MTLIRTVITLLLFNIILPPLLFACPFHDLVTDNLTKELSYTVSYYIKTGRAQGKIKEPNNNSMVMYLFLKSLNKTPQDSIVFNFRQSIDGHMSTINITSKSTLLEYNPKRQVPMLITEMDILWGLVQGQFSWQWVKSEGFATINGTAEQRSALDRILSEKYIYKSEPEQE